METLIEKIENLIGTDTENLQSIDDSLSQYYRESTEDERKRIDLCFIALCGYGLGTLLIDHEREDGEINEGQEMPCPKCGNMDCYRSCTGMQEG